MKTFLLLLALALSGVVIGVGSAVWVMRGGWTASRGAVEIDTWRADWTIGSRATDPYTRARVALKGLLALPKSEAVYFIRSVDDAGRPLREACDYALEGGAAPAAWWSVTLYDTASRLPMNSGDALSVDATGAGEAEAWSARVSATPPADDSLWISSQAAGDFDLTLRLYRPAQALLDDPAAVLDPPRIRRLGCRGDAA